MRCGVGIFLAFFVFTAAGRGQEPLDLKLKVVPIDADAKDRLLSVRVDTRGRVFIGGRDALHVCEPDDRGGYQPRKLLYSFPERTWINDIEVRGDDLYVLTASALYVFFDGVRKRADLTPRKLLWGVPGGLPGAGFRKLAWGPEGDLYFTVGGVVPEGRCGYWTFFSQSAPAKTPYRGIGGVFRCKPDGSGLQVVAHGLRRPSVLTFDRHWNLFTCDRTTEKSAQLGHITPHGRFGKPIGPADGLAPLLSIDSAEFRAGPIYYDDALLPAEWRDRILFVSMGRIESVGLEPRGASFKATGGPASTSAAPTTWAVGRGGRIFTVEDGVAMLTKADDPALHPFEPYEAADATDKKLWQELSDPSWQRRYRAHIEMTRRGGMFLRDANKRLLNVKAGDPALHHLIWLAAKSGQGSLHLLGLVDHADAKVRVQAIRALAEFPEQLREEPIFTKALLDDDAQVRHAALLACFDPRVTAGRPVQQAIERGPACCEDRYLRQTAALFLAAKATRKQLEAMCASIDAPTRLAGVLAAGYRLTLPGAADPLAQLAQQLPLDTQGISKLEFADGKRDLRDHGRLGMFTPAEHWKADMHTEEQELLFKLLRKMLHDADEPVRMQAASFLAVLDDARCKAEVARVLKK